MEPITLQFLIKSFKDLLGILALIILKENSREDLRIILTGIFQKCMGCPKTSSIT